jgi:DNA invertase Pin-like site-specific DNA recombinase
MRDPADIATRDMLTGAAGCGKVFAEKITGTRRTCPQLDRMLDHLRAGDVIVVTRRWWQRWNRYREVRARS